MVLHLDTFLWSMLLHTSLCIFTINKYYTLLDWSLESYKWHKNIYRYWVSLHLRRRRQKTFSSTKHTYINNPSVRWVKNHTESEYTKKKIDDGKHGWMWVDFVILGCVNNKDKVEISWWLFRDERWKKNAIF